MTWNIIAQLVISGLALGFIYSLVAIEYTIIFNSTGLLNFSHDKFILIGTYIFAAQFITRMSTNYAVGIISTIIVMCLFGVLVSMGIFNPLRNMASPIFAVMGTVFLGRIITECVRLIWGPIPFTLSGFMKGTVQIGSVIITKANLTIICVSALLVLALQFFFKKTKTGKAMRCVQQNKTASVLVGSNVSRNINITIA